MKKILNKEFLAAALVLIPYLENNFTQEYLQWYFSESYIRAVTTVSLGVIILVLIDTFIRSKRHYLLEVPKANFMFILFVIYAGIITIALSNNMVLSVCSWIWVATPIIFAIIVLNYYLQLELDFRKLAKSGIIWFAAYLTLVLTYYIVAHRLFIDSTVRMSPRGGGAVIFGYTIALFFAFTMIFKNEFSKYGYYLLLILFTIGALGTTTRGSVWLVAVLWVANFYFSKLTRARIVLFLSAVPVLGLVSMIDFSAFETTTFVGFGRLLNIHSFRRATSSSSIMDAFNGMPVSQKLFGSGLGNFFPYQKWAIYTNDIENNMFDYEGHTILVQPHNSFLYILMECGIIGVIICAVGFLVCMVYCFSNRNPRWIYKIIFIGSIILLNCLDSVFFVQPGAAYLFWLLLFIVVCDDNILREKEFGMISSPQGEST